MVRIQRQRAKGWSKPDNTVYIGRGSKWGNPFKVIGDMVYGDAGHRRKILGPYIFIEVCPTETDARLMCIALYEKWIKRKKEIEPLHVIPCPFTIDELREQLGGKNLMCFCKQGEPCHGDVLLKMANKKPGYHKPRLL